MPHKYTNKLAGKRVLVFGGTSGIGFCIAENALENGAIVIVASSRQTSIDKTINRLHESYPEFKANISGHVIDLTSDSTEQSLIKLFDDVTNNGTDLLDHIISTAADSVPIQPLDKFTGVDMLAATMKIKLVATMFIAKLGPGKYLHMSNKSSITLTGGVNTYQPGNGWTIPASLGSSLIGLVRALAVDLRPVRVNLVDPGAIETELFQRTFEGDQLRQLLSHFKENTLTKTIGNPEDMSEAYIYAMKDSFLTGTTILSDGGLLLVPGTTR